MFRVFGGLVVCFFDQYLYRIVHANGIVRQHIRVGGVVGSARRVRVKRHARVANDYSVAYLSLVQGFQDVQGFLSRSIEDVSADVGLLPKLVGTLIVTLPDREIRFVTDRVVNYDASGDVDHYFNCGIGVAFRIITAPVERQSRRRRVTFDLHIQWIFEQRRVFQFFQRRELTAARR